MLHRSTHLDSEAAKGVTAEQSKRRRVHTCPLERLVAQHSNFSVVGSAALLDRAVATFAARVKLVLHNVSPELLLLLMSESCIVCVRVLRP